ncbi:(E3-independent) E2 ubiquitin-conjugating enzyme UBE2O [Episyrphus balteatus]|uniref:(E3-independent) E2 ubiquitin-conjugating enzyme UBE2O n=1 Tax=Episyrphus balteatus TaxID=286459 RepID=UPI0024852E22|nr:(E3-independent) E2 ubiquitin-conjugating enzyme UBE2O [Episyrphus balteatus]
MATGVTYTAPQSSTTPPPSTPPPPQPPPKVCVNPAAGSTSVDNQYFYEDEIFRIDKKGRVKFGLVLENSETFSGDDDDELDVLSKGEIRVIWHPEGKEEVITDRVVGLADRTLMPGDVVRRLVPGKDTQRGYCREINMRSDVRILGTKNIIKNVMAERLQPMVRMPRDSAVCLDSWVGSVKCVSEKIVLKSSCGALIEVSDLELINFTDTNTKFRNGHFAEMVYYPGQVINGRLESMDNVKILSPTNKNWKPLSRKFRKFTVQSVRLHSVWVHWQCKALSEDGDIKSNLLQQPDPTVTGADLDRLKRLNLFESCMLQINDKSFLKFADCDVVVRKSVWEKEHAIKYKLLLSQQEKEEHLNKNQSRSTKAPTPFRNEKTKANKFSNSSLEAPGQEKQSLRMSLKPLSKANLEKFNTSKERNETEKKTVDGETQQQNQNQVVSADGWQTDEDEADGLDDDEDETESTATTISTCSSPTPRSSPKHTSRLQKKQVKKLKKSSTGASSSTPLPNIGDELVTEAMMVYSTATVVWQDGAVESGISSTQLYPIHHLDDHEFFPGDFVVCGKEDSDVSFRDYGVIQTVDHHGRTASVKWFTTYTSAVEPKPTYKGQSEMSVYDLKDHPDFQYRPGTMVIRVANFLGEDATCTAGQIIDNYIDGRVKVWWVDGHISMCWPQDLFEVGQYDHADWAHDTDDSWETESETSEFGGDTPQLKFSESHILTNFERARVAISELEEIFSLNPNLQNHEVMKKLLVVYKNCRYLDRLMSTSFFHESHFMGLLERVGKDTMDTTTISERPSQDRKNRLFSDSTTQHSQQAIGIVVPVNSTQTNTSSVSSPKDYAPKVIFNISSTPFKCLKKKATKSELTTPSNTSSNPLQEFTELQSPPKQPHNTPINTKVTASDPSKSPFSQEKNKLLTSVMLNIEKATEKTSQLKLANNKSQDDSGNYTRTENCDGSSTSYASSNDLTNIDTNGSFLKTNDDQQSVSCSSIEFTDDAPPEFVCIRLCCLLKEQLVKCINEIRQKYFVDNLNLSEIIENDIVDDLDVIIETTNEVVAENNLHRKSIEMTPDTPTVEDQPETVVSTPNVPLECFQVLDVAPKTHKYELTILQPNNSQQYYKAVQREHRMLRSSLPPGVWVRVFEDRMDLVSVMIAGPKNTPYEDGMFFFDIQLGRDYPKSPPSCHYISYCSDRLNPNLYEDGKVCVSLLGTWSGRDTEVWGPNSTLLQVIVSIQGLILVAEPYFNEAGYEKQRGTQQGTENSRMYNEMAIIKLVQATTKLLSNPPPIFREQIVEHFKKNGLAMYNRIKGWMELSQIANTPDTEQQSFISNDVAPDFPLVPASRGFCLTVSGLLETFHKKLDTLDATLAVAEQP